MFKQTAGEKLIELITVPVLVTVGRHDWITPVVASEDIAREIPNSTLVIFENSGHSPHREENEKYLKLLRDFKKLAAIRFQVNSVKESKKYVKFGLPGQLLFGRLFHF